MSPWLLANTTATLMFLAALALATAILLRRSYRYFGRRSRNSEPLVRLPRPAPQSHHGMTGANSAKQEIELYETAREITGRLDSKMIALEQLIVDVQRRVDRLEQLLTKLEEASTSASDSN